MTLDDVKRLAQVLQPLVGCIPNEEGTQRPFTQAEFDDLVKRQMTAIRAGSRPVPQFDDQGFKEACRTAITEKLLAPPADVEEVAHDT